MSIDRAADGIDEGFGIGASGQRRCQCTQFEGREFPEIAPCRAIFECTVGAISARRCAGLAERLRLLLLKRE